MLSICLRYVNGTKKIGFESLAKYLYRFNWIYILLLITFILKSRFFADISSFYLCKAIFLSSISCKLKQFLFIPKTYTLYPLGICLVYLAKTYNYIILWQKVIIFKVIFLQKDFTSKLIWCPVFYESLPELFCFYCLLQ